LDRSTFLFTGTHAGLSGFAVSVPAQPQQRIVFLDPGESVGRGAGPFWPLVARAMSAWAPRADA